MDGAYLVPNDLEGIKACFSPGVNNRKTFEDELTTQHGMHCYMCDVTSDVDQLSTPLISGSQTFDKKWLDIDGSPDSVSLQQWIDLYVPDPAQDLLLQIDIEGAEYRNLNAASEATMQRFRIIIIELHGLPALLDPSQAEIELAPLLRKLDKTHVCVHAHPNNCCGEVVDPESGRNIPVVIEMTLLRRDRLELGQESSVAIPPCMPHPLDISRNVPDKAPLHMNPNWLEGATLNVVSQLKRAEDNLEFITYLRETERPELNNFLASEAAVQVSLRNLYQIACGPGQNGDFTAANLDDLDQAEIAKGKIFHLGDSYSGFPKVGVVQDMEPFFFHTALGIGQFITIDLVHPAKLAWLVLKNRSDCSKDRARHLFYSVHDRFGFNPARVLPVLTPADFLYAADGLSVTPLLGQLGRYFTLYSPAFSAIHLSSLRLYTSKDG